MFAIFAAMTFMITGAAILQTLPRLYLFRETFSKGQLYHFKRASGRHGGESSLESFFSDPSVCYDTELQRYRIQGILMGLTGTEKENHSSNDKNVTTKDKSAKTDGTHQETDLVSLGPLRYTQEDNFDASKVLVEYNWIATAPLHIPKSEVWYITPASTTFGKMLSKSQEQTAWIFRKGVLTSSVLEYIVFILPNGESATKTEQDYEELDLTKAAQPPLVKLKFARAKRPSRLTRKLKRQLSDELWRNPQEPQQIHNKNPPSCEFEG